MTREALLLEIGCEEIPARMIDGAAAEFCRRVSTILSAADLDAGEARAWGGSRRLAVHIADVEGRQRDRVEVVLGPPAQVAFKGPGELTAAGLGFAKKQGATPDVVEQIETDKGLYAGFRRRVAGREIGQVLADALPTAVGSIPFVKTMRWGDGRFRWVRPVHWVVALHGDRVLDLEIFAVRAGRSSRGHRFLSQGDVPLASATSYLAALQSARVVVEPEERRNRLAAELVRCARAMGGTVVDDPALLEEVSQLVEWPGVVAGRFNDEFLGLPRELLVTTLRHHQKCFSLQDDAGVLLSGFLAVANTDRDPGGHVRRGNEWVVGGRLEDAKFFWTEDRKSGLADRSPRLARVVFHARLGSYADKSARMAPLAVALAERLRSEGLSDAPSIEACREAGLLAKNDLVTGTVGEFPELQGRVGGLMLSAEGRDERVWRAVYEHYQPQGHQDPVPSSPEGGVVSIADKLDTVAGLVLTGEVPTGSRDPYGVRRATNGIFRVLLQRSWPISIADLVGFVGADASLELFLADRAQHFFRDRDHTPNEVRAVFNSTVKPSAAVTLALPDIEARLLALRGVREREDFARLVELTRRLDTILDRNDAGFREAAAASTSGVGYEESEPAARELWELADRLDAEITGQQSRRRYDTVVETLAAFVAPVERFFSEVLVVDPARPAAMAFRGARLSALRATMTRCFDLRELAGQAERRG